MQFTLSITINCHPSDAFAFLRDIEQHPQKEGSQVLVLEKTTPGPPGVGTRYREVVQMLPFIKGEIISEIVHFKHTEGIAMNWDSRVMHGNLAYDFQPENGGTKLILREVLYCKGLFRLLAPFVQIMFPRALKRRLRDIKEILESAIHR
jgi:hypothetical protein